MLATPLNLLCHRRHYLYNLLLNGYIPRCGRLFHLNIQDMLQAARTNCRLHKVVVKEVRLTYVCCCICQHTACSSTDHAIFRHESAQFPELFRGCAQLHCAHPLGLVSLARPSLKERGSGQTASETTCWLARLPGARVLLKHCGWRISLTNGCLIGLTRFVGCDKCAEMIPRWLWVESAHVGRSSHVFRGALFVFCRGIHWSHFARVKAKNCQSIFHELFSGDLCNSVYCVLCAQLRAKRDSDRSGASLLAN